MSEPKIESITGISIDCICNNGEKKIIHWEFNEPTKNVHMTQGISKKGAIQKEGKVRSRTWNSPPYDIKLDIECQGFNIIVVDKE